MIIYCEKIGPGHVDPQIYLRSKPFMRLIRPICDDEGAFIWQAFSHRRDLATVRLKRRIWRAIADTGVRHTSIAWRMGFDTSTIWHGVMMARVHGVAGLPDCSEREIRLRLQRRAHALKQLQKYRARRRAHVCVPMQMSAL